MNDYNEGINNTVVLNNKNSNNNNPTTVDNVDNDNERIKNICIQFLLDLKNESFFKFGTWNSEEKNFNDLIDQIINDIKNINNNQLNGFKLNENILVYLNEKVGYLYPKNKKKIYNDYIILLNNLNKNDFINQENALKIEKFNEILKEYKQLQQNISNDDDDDDDYDDDHDDQKIINFQKHRQALYNEKQQSNKNNNNNINNNTRANLDNSVQPNNQKYTNIILPGMSEMNLSNNNNTSLTSTLGNLLGTAADSFVDGGKSQIISFLNEFKNQSFFNNNAVDNTLKKPINDAIDAIIGEINDINASNLKDKSKKFKILLIQLRNVFNDFYEKVPLPPELKSLSQKYVDLLNKLNFETFISAENIQTIMKFQSEISSLQNNFNGINNNYRNTRPNSINLITDTPIQTGINAVNNSSLLKGINNLTGTPNPPPHYNKYQSFVPPVDAVGSSQQLSEKGQALIDSAKSKVPENINPNAALSGMIPKGIMPEGLGESGPLSSIYEMIIKKKIEDTFQKIQENICATFNDYKDKIGEAMLQKIIDKIEKHSEDFKKFSDVMNDEESKEVDNENKNQEGDENNNKGPIDKDKIEDNIFYKIYNNINAVIETKHEKNGTGETKKDFSDSIIEKYEAWKKLKGIKTIVKEKTDVDSINGGGDGGLMDAFNMAKAAFNAMPLPDAVNKNIKEELAKGFKITDDATIKENEGENGDDKVNEEENKTYMDIAVNKSIANLKFDFGIPQLDLICEKVFFGLHNPTILIIKLLTTMNIEDRNKLILDMIKINEGIDNDENKQAEFKKKYGIIEWPKQGGFPDKEWPKNKTPWMDDIYCRIFPHTKCHGEKDPEKKKKKTDKNDEKENDKKPDKNDEKKDKTDKNNEKEDVKKKDNFNLRYVDSFSVSPPIEKEKKGGYENYIQKPRKTRRKRLVKKGNRKNKTYHRRGSLVKAV